MARGKKCKGSATTQPFVKTIAPSGEHTHTVVLLHGSYYDHGEFGDPDSPEFFIPGLVNDVASEVPEAAVEGIKYVFPDSPQNDDGDNFWYDYTADDDAEEMQCDNDAIDLAQWEAQLARISSIVDEEVRALGDASKVIIGGNSAGGTLAIHVALNRSEPLGGLFCLRTCPMRLTLGPADCVPLEGEPDGSCIKDGLTDMPIFVYAAGKDDTYVPDLQKRNFAFLEDAGFSISHEVNPEGLHEDDDPLENAVVASWIVNVFFDASTRPPMLDEAPKRNCIVC
eukprot:TRINITY_DN16179_c0_g1_i1.p1 TRINITY_DN16179_c0_g1~~TRINITY_DN16179_c0_g1_i1.p1  ORF type:complete len:306 (-),score=46.47 TRINITY_DN16179_c0_g1_i1:362-1207(-)